MEAAVCSTDHDGQMMESEAVGDYNDMVNSTDSRRLLVVLAGAVAADRMDIVNIDIPRVLVEMMRLLLPLLPLYLLLPML